MSPMIQYTATAIGTEAAIPFRADTVIALPPKRPIFFLKNHRSSSMLPRAEREEASARPPCSIGPIRSRLKRKLSRKAMKAVVTGVFVSFSA